MSGLPSFLVLAVLATLLLQHHVRLRSAWILSPCSDSSNTCLCRWCRHFLHRQKGGCGVAKLTATFGMICGVKSTCGIRVSHRVHYPVTISDRDRCQNVTTFTGTSIQVNTLRFFKISQGLVLVICFLCRSLVMSSRFFPVHKQTFKTFLGCLIGFSGGSGLNQRGGMLSFRSVKSGGVELGDSYLTLFSF